MASQGDSFTEGQRKYSEEREKRLRPDLEQQFADIKTSKEFQHFFKEPWPEAAEAAKRPPILTNGSKTKFLLLGGGFGAVLHAIRLIDAGFSSQDLVLVDTASSLGGTWSWNRYPGLMCDIEAYIYMPCLEETGYMPKTRYAYGQEIREYFNILAEHWHFADRFQPLTEVNHADWDDEAKEWKVKLKSNHGEVEVTTQFLISSGGLLNWPHLPKLDGLSDFNGDIFHTSRWNYNVTGGSQEVPDLVNLKNKRVGIIGTGATAVQCIPHLAKWAKELHVFQRTPSSIDKRGQGPTDTEVFKSQVATGKGWWQERNQNFADFGSNVQPPPKVDLVSDGWTGAPAQSALLGGPSHKIPMPMEDIPAYVGWLHSIDFPRMERVRARVDEVVKDPKTAKSLKAWYPQWCKRPCFHDDYLATFNQPNVHLVDTDGKGVDHLTSTGVVYNGQEYPVDVLIMSTGFRGPGIGSPVARSGMTVTGRGGIDFEQKWTDGTATLHGVCSHDFPNLFWPAIS